MATVGFAYGSFGDILESIRIIAKIIDTARRGGKPSSEWEMTEKDLKALNEVLSYLSTHQGTLLDHFVADRLLKESERCKATTLSIHSKITASRGLYERIRWAVTEENTLAEYRAVLAVHRAALDEVHKLIIGAMLKDTQNSVVEVGKNFREDVKGISQQLTDHEQTVSDALIGVRDHVEEQVQHSVSGVAQQLRDQEAPLNDAHSLAVKEKLQKWLNSPPNMLEKQRATELLHHNGTGNWFLGDYKFRTWKYEPGSLWIEGQSGTGKTVLSSTVIRKLFDDRKPGAIGYFYFDFREEKTRRVEIMLHAIILQLSAQSSRPYAALDELYKSLDGQILPTYENLLTILERLLLECGRTYIILDALDESQDADRLVEFISRLRNWNSSPLHLFFTSQARTTFKGAFRDVAHVPLEFETTKDDIHKFVANELQTKSYLSHLAKHGEEVTAKVVIKSNGMFRLAACLLVELSRIKVAPDLDAIITSLPGDLFGIYARFLKAISEPDFFYVAVILRWLAFSGRPVSLLELEDALAFNLSDPQPEFVYEPTRRGDSAEVVCNLLEGLVMVGVPQSTGFRPVSLAHASVADYIVSDVFFRQYEYDLKAEPSHTFLAQTCLGYLLHYHVGLGEYPILDTRSKIRSDYPLALYAAQFWSYHLFRCDAQKKPELLDSTMRLLKSGNSQYIALNKLRHRATRAVYQWSGMQFPLCMCIRLGYMDGFHFLLNNGANVDGDGSDITPLHCAAAFGRGDIVRLLLDKGANIGGAMVGASRNGETDIVRLLLQNGADVDTGYDYHVSALEAASYRGHTDIVRLLLENGANPNLNGCRALEGASRNNYPDILDLLLKADANANQDDGEALRRAPMNARIIRPLLEHGADPNIDESYLLRDAANSGNMEIVQLLLKYDADVDATPSGSHTPLHCAACKGYTDIVRLLLDNGANAKADEGWALQEALTQGYTAIARMLLNQGVDVNVRGGAMLTEACKRGNIDDVRLLLDNGGMGVYSALYEASVAGRTDIADLLFTKLADVDCYDGAALWIASRKGHIDMVALLIERGVHVNPSLPRPLDSNSDTALTAASQNGHTAIVRLLLEKGAEVNADEGLALMYASRNNYREVVSLLLEAGADVNAVGGRHGFRTALQCASYQKHIHVMALLLENGATFNAEDELDENMLQSAALAGQISTVRLVLEKGAIDNRSKDRALHCAALKGHAGIVALLLQHGADVNANSDICCDEEDDEHEVLDSLLLTHSDHTALTCAVANGHLELVRRLLENGADIHTDALVYASKKGQKDALDILLESGVNLKAGGGEALTAASQQGRVDIVQLLLDRGVDVNSCEGMAFVAAAYCGHVDVVRLLSENGVKIDPEAGNTDHSGALVHAAAGGHINIVHFLLAKGANVNAAGGLALLAAAGRGHIDVARLLLENGADVTANNEDGTALQIAANEGHTEIASLLHEYGAVEPENLSDLESDTTE